MQEPKHWTTLTQLIEERASKQGLEPESLKEQALTLFQDFKTKGYISITCKKALSMNIYIWVYFYRALIAEKAKDGRVPLPFEDRENSEWMSGVDFCFINARATALEKEKTGTFLEAMKIIPVLRVKAIHLAPFFDCIFENLYAVDSLSMITDQVVDLELVAQGLSKDDQLQCFVDACHLTGKAVGFDLEPHTSQFSRIVLANPHLFRWLHLNEYRTFLAEGVNQDEMLSEAFQNKIVAEVQNIVDERLAKAGLASIEDPNAKPETIRQVHLDITYTLIKEGYWTLPSHTWGGVGLPKFKRYKYEGDKEYPVFDYLNEKGEDHLEHAFGMLTPYKFYTHLPINAVPKKEAPPQYFEEAIKFLKGVFPKIQKKFEFDFVRVDYVDHVFDAFLPDDPDIPVSDRMIPPVIAEIIKEARREKTWIGAMAERMGLDIENYRKIGFDLILGIDILTTVHQNYLIDLLRSNYKLGEQNRIAATPASILSAVDTHDSGHPKFWTKPVSEVIGSKGMKLRHFVSRFSSVGLGNRPKYECMGNQDLSSGLYLANNKAQSLDWVGDEDYNRHYHNLEDMYEYFAPLLKQGEITNLDLKERVLWWFINRMDLRQRLLCVVYLEKEYKKLAEYLEDKEKPLPVHDISIDFTINYPFSDPDVFQVDIENAKLVPTGVIRHSKIFIPKMESYDYRLYWIKESIQE